MNEAIQYLLKPHLTNEALNDLFKAGQSGSDTRTWQSVFSHSLTYIGAFDADNLVGFVNVAWDGRDHAFLLDPRVKGDYRRRGIGRELVRRAVECAREASCEWLHVDFERELWPFYRSCGFGPTEAGLIRLR